MRVMSAMKSDAERYSRQVSNLSFITLFLICGHLLFGYANFPASHFLLYRVEMQLLLSLAHTPPVHQPESDSAVIFLSASQSIVISVAKDSGKIPIHGDASAKATLYRDRFLLLLHRLSRDQHFSKPAFDTERSQFGNYESLIGLTGGRWVMGVISQLKDGHFYLEDLTGTSEINV
ncbi:DNA polymerase epsilon subunit B [Camellia lanceoleosa]|uniref:DNA polymerase epsilon subunit B n=1 Tax=Camellia lanceoleosa TaxID=1840588 RepID=A0ACC0F380_9ERIC|nr:DNA polymerase epsilon subunit B [Camellia lanceoleosa]